MESIHRNAVVMAITIENRNLNYCCAVMSKVTDNETRQVFELLAEVKAKHVEALCRLYPGCADELDCILNTNNVYADPYYCSLMASIDGESPEFEALRIARKEEHACIELYSVFVDIFREPHVRDVFARILNETRKQGDMIKKEYMRLMNVVAGTGHDVFACE